MDTSLIARGATPIELDRQRYLFFDIAATWLLIQRYGMNFVAALCRTRGTREGEPLELVSMDALVFFLYAGLLAEAATRNEEISEDFVRRHIVPFNVRELFLQVTIALSRSNNTPALPGDMGKDETAAAGPAGAVAQPGPQRVSTSTKRAVSRSASSGKRRKTSTRKR